MMVWKNWHRIRISQCFSLSHDCGILCCQWDRSAQRCLDFWFAEKKARDLNQFRFKKENFKMKGSITAGIKKTSSDLRKQTNCLQLGSCIPFEQDSGSSEMNCIEHLSKLQQICDRSSSSSNVDFNVLYLKPVELDLYSNMQSKCPVYQEKVPPPKVWQTPSWL